jgi:hypothetical protein
MVRPTWNQTNPLLTRKVTLEDIMETRQKQKERLTLWKQINCSIETNQFLANKEGYVGGHHGNKTRQKQRRLWKQINRSSIAALTD